MKPLISPAILVASLLAAVVFASSTFRVSAAEEDPAVAARKALEAVTAVTQNATNTEAELRLTQQAIEKLRREVELRAAQNSEALTTSLRLIEISMGRMHDRHMEDVQNSNRAVLTVAGVFAGVGIIGIIFIIFLLARALGRFSEIAVQIAPRTPLLGPGPSQNGGLLGGGEGGGQRGGSAEESSTRFQGAIDQLQKRILELEHSLQPATSAGGSTTRPVIARTQDGTNNIEPLMPEDSPETNVAPPASRASVLLGKGQALMNLEAVESAMQCFNEALELEPNNAEALVKQGMAFEKLQDWERSLESYDRAIAADASMTVAYLYRGGVCNRLQRYREALESYEQALRTEKSSRAS
jgi:Tetratricopeptide repeat